MNTYKDTIAYCKAKANAPVADSKAKALATIAACKEKAKTLVVVDGLPVKDGYRLSVYGGIVNGVQVIDFDSKDAAMQWLMGTCYPLYFKAGKTVRPNVK